MSEINKRKAVSSNLRSSVNSAKAQGYKLDRMSTKTSAITKAKIKKQNSLQEQQEEEDSVISRSKSKNNNLYVDEEDDSQLGFDDMFTPYDSNDDDFEHENPLFEHSGAEKATKIVMKGLGQETCMMRSTVSRSTIKYVPAFLCSPVKYWMIPLTINENTSL